MENIAKGDFFYEFNCHMNPAIHLSPVVYYTAMLCFKYSLNYLEVISVMNAWVNLQWTVVYFCQGCLFLLKDNKLKVRGIFLGLHLFEQMKILHDKIKVSKKKNPGLRYNDYHKVLVPDKTKWANSVKHMTHTCLKTFKQASQSQYKKYRMKCYHETFNQLHKVIHGANVLKINHLMGAMAMLGTLPLWYVEYYHGLHTCKGIKKLVQKFNLGATQQNIQTFMKSFQQALSIKEDRLLSIRECENIVCKVYRKDNIKSNDTKWKDVVFYGQILFEPYIDHIVIHRAHIKHDINVYQNSSKDKLLSGPILQYWPFGDKWITLNTFCEQVTIDSFNDFQNNTSFSINVKEYTHPSKKYLCNM